MTTGLATPGGWRLPRSVVTRATVLGGVAILPALAALVLAGPGAAVGVGIGLGAGVAGLMLGPANRRGVGRAFILLPALDRSLPRTEPASRRGARTFGT